VSEVHWLCVTCIGPGEFISDDPVQLDEWTTIIAERSRNDGSLIVNDAPAVKGILLYLFIYLLTKRYIHIAMYKESRTRRHR